MNGAVDTADWMNFAITLFMFFFAQIVALFIWSRRSKAEQIRERTRLEEKQEEESEQQMTELRTLVNTDIGAVREEVSDIRHELNHQQQAQSQQYEQMHGHMRRIEESRPTREEMEKNMAQLKELVISTKADLEKAVSHGFHALDRRFDEFKDYTRELWSHRKD